MWGKKARGKKNTLLKRSVFLEIVHHTIYSFSTDTPSFSRPQLHLLQFEKNDPFRKSIRSKKMFAWNSLPVRRFLGETPDLHQPKVKLLLLSPLMLILLLMVNYSLTWVITNNSFTITQSKYY